MYHQKTGLQRTRIKVIVSSTELDSESIYVNYFLQKSYVQWAGALEFLCDFKLVIYITW